MKKSITLIIGGLLLVGGFAGGIVYKSSNDHEATSEYNKSNSAEVENINIEVKSKENEVNNKDKIEVNYERRNEINKARLSGASKAAESNPNYTNDDVNKSVANELKSIGVTKEEAESCNIDKDVIKYLN